MPSVKLKFEGIVKQIKIDKDLVVFEDLRAHAEASFETISKKSSLNFIWEDEDGDKIHCSKDDEIEEAFSSMIAAKKKITFEIEIAASMPLDAIQEHGKSPKQESAMVRFFRHSSLRPSLEN